MKWLCLWLIYLFMIKVFFDRVVFVFFNEFVGVYVLREGYDVCFGKFVWLGIEFVMLFVFYIVYLFFLVREKGMMEVIEMKI